MRYCPTKSNAYGNGILAPLLLSFSSVSPSYIFQSFVIKEMWKLLQRINKNLIIAIPMLMVSGFAAGLSMDAAPLKKLIIPFTFLMVYPMMVTLKIKKCFEGGDSKAQILTQLINFGVIPFVALAWASSFLKTSLTWPWDYCWPAWCPPAA
jgi:ACR3 family arsenite efflux pump ArsB